MSRQENEPLPGHLEIDGVRMTVPPLEQADIKAGICLLSSEGKEAGWIRTNVPAAKKKGFLQWAARVLFGRLFAKKGEKERFWSSAGDVAAGEFPLSDTGDLHKRVDWTGGTVRYERKGSSVLPACQGRFAAWGKGTGSRCF